jgi:hypothetical protein
VLARSAPTAPPADQGANITVIGKAGTMAIRGFQDSQYKVIFDGIPFGDSSDLHHTTGSLFIAHALQQAQIDRGPGTASTISKGVLDPGPDTIVTALERWVPRHHRRVRRWPNMATITGFAAISTGLAMIIPTSNMSSSGRGWAQSTSRIRSITTASSTPGPALACPEAGRDARPGPHGGERHHADRLCPLYRADGSPVWGRAMKPLKASPLSSHGAWATQVHHAR